MAEFFPHTFPRKGKCRGQSELGHNTPHFPNPVQLRRPPPELLQILQFQKRGNTTSSNIIFGHFCPHPLLWVLPRISPTSCTLGIWLLTFLGECKSEVTPDKCMVVSGVLDSTWQISCCWGQQNGFSLVTDGEHDGCEGTRCHSYYQVILVFCIKLETA